MTWPLVQVRHVARFRYGSSLRVDGRVDGDIAVYGSNGPVGLHDACNTRSPVIIVGRKGSHGKVRYSSAPVFAIDTTYYIDSTCTSSDINWLHYALSIIGLDILGHDVGVPGLNRDQAYSQLIPLPPYKVQRMIADHLDSETARIDALIARKRQLTRLLEERKSLLAEATLAALRISESSVPLKYLAYESDLRCGSDSDPTMLSVSIHHGVTPRSAPIGEKSRADELSRHKKCSIGDIVINRMRAFQGAVGVVGQAGVVSPDYTVLQVGSQVSPAYLHYVMRSSWFVSEMTRRLRGIGATDQGQVRTPRINFVDLGLIKVPVPQRETQDELCRDLAIQEARLTRAVDLHVKQLALLAERRQAFITAIVTNEMQVPKTDALSPAQTAFGTRDAR